MYPTHSTRGLGTLKAKPRALTSGPRVKAGSSPSRVRSPTPRRRSNASSVIQRIAADAIKDSDNSNHVSVGPAAEGDPTLLFLRSGGQTRLVVGVPPEVIRAPRLRGTSASRRELGIERERELFRLADADEDWNKHIDGIA